MQLPFLKSREPQKNFFLALLVKPFSLGAILFEEINDKLFILSTHEADVVNDTGKLTGEDLLAACDKVITSIEASLPAGGSVEKTIFSLPYDWIVDNKIKPEYLDRLKTVCKSLELTPIGYLTSIEATVHFIEKGEGAPVSAIFIEVAKPRVFTYLVRGGKILEALSSDVEEDILGTCENLFRKIESVDVLPAKIILLDYGDAQQMQQEFLSHRWPADIPFLHVPQVVTLEHGFENEATINGVSTQMELEVLSDVKIQDAEIAEKEVLEEVSSEELGFVKGKDIARSGSEVLQEAEVLEGLEKPSEALDGVDGKKSSRKTTEEEPNIKYFKEDREEGSELEEPSSGEQRAGSPFPVNLSAITSIVKSVKIPGFPKISMAGGPFKAKLIAGLVGLVLFIIAFSFIYYNFILHAQVVIFADKKAVSKTAGVTFSKDGSGGGIKLNIVQEEAKGEDSKNSTGTKETGDKAAGSVTIYNKADTSKTFPKGTIIVGTNSLEFVTQSDVNIASTSAFSTTLSSASVKIQAAKFGKEYNLPSSSNFTVKGVSSSDTIGKNSDAISGGTSKTTTVVSKKDLQDLLASVTSKLESQAMADAKKNLSSDEVFFPKALGSDVKDTTYTKKENDEAGSAGLSATISYSIGSYKKEDLDQFVKNLSKNEVPGTYILQQGISKTDITDIKIGKDGNSAAATLKVNAVYSPQIDTGKLATALASKSLTSADKQIRNVTGVTDVNISFSNKIPLFPAILPANAKNITVTVKN